MKRITFFKSLLVAAGLLTGVSAWGATETLSGGDATDKDAPIAKTSFTVLGTYNPSGSSTINSKNCIKVRWKRSDASTGNTNGFALKVNSGYMITKVEAQMSGNSSDLVLADIKVDGTSYAGSYSKTLNGSGQSTKYTNITLTGIAATNYINFEYSSGGSSQQGFVYMTVTYVKVNQWDFTDSEIWGAIALPTAENNTKNYQYNGIEGTSGNYVTFYSSDGSGLRHAGSLANGIGFSKTGSTSDHYVKMSVPGGCTVIITANVTSNRTVKVIFDGVDQGQISGDYSDESREFSNDTEEAKDLYIYCNQNADGNTKQPYLKKIVLKETVKVTTNFVDEEDNVIKTASVENVEVGSTYSTTYDATYYVSNTDPYKYAYVSGAVSGVTINAAAEYTVVYHKSERASYTLNVTQSYGAKSQKLVNSQTVLEGASYTYYYPKFILDGTTLYEYAESTDPGASSSYWYGVISNMSDNKDYTLTYNAKDGVCVYYSEGEDVVGKSGQYVYTNWRRYMSNNSSGVFNNTILTTLGKGTYKVTVRANGRNDRYVDIHKTSNDGERILHAQAANAGKESTEMFSLTENTAIVANGGYVSNENGHGLDYVYIMKIVESGTITPAGWATFASNYPLDLSTISGGTAYYASETSGSTVTLTSTTATVPVGEGIMVKGTAGETFTIDVAASGTAIGGNLLKGQTTTSNVAASAAGTYHYVFGYKTSDPTEFGFYNLAADTEVAAGKAYLETTTELTGARLAIVFDDETTGIQSMDNGQWTMDNVYDLQGRRVAQPQKGLYIVNGKKVVIK